MAQTPPHLHRHANAPFRPRSGRRQGCGTARGRTGSSSAAVLAGQHLAEVACRSNIVPLMLARPAGTSHAPWKGPPAAPALLLAAHSQRTCACIAVPAAGATTGCLGGGTCAVLCCPQKQAHCCSSLPRCSTSILALGGSGWSTGWNKAPKARPEHRVPAAQRCSWHLRIDRSCIAQHKSLFLHLTGCSCRGELNCELGVNCGPSLDAYIPVQGRDGRWLRGRALSVSLTVPPRPGAA